MKKMRIYVLYILLIMFVPHLFAIGMPKIIHPSDPDKVCTSPTFRWSPVKNAVSYSYKLKELNVDGTTASVVTEGTVAAPTTSLTVSSLTVSSTYKLILRAIDGASVQSTKEKFYFYTVDTNVVITHAQLVDRSDTVPASAAIRSYGRNDVFFSPSSNYSGAISPVDVNNYAGHAQVILPDGATITGFKARYRDSSTINSLGIELVRFPKTTMLSESISFITSDIAGTTSLTQTSGTLDTSTVVVDNKNYFYELSVFIPMADVDFSAFVDAQIDYTE